MGTIAIVGASSFVGAHVLAAAGSRSDLAVRAVIHERPLRAGCYPANVRVVYGDLLKPDSLREPFSDASVVVNLSYLRNADLETNLRAVRNLRAACIAGGVKRLVHCSTAMVYGKVRQDVIDESTPCSPRTAYEVTKWAMDEFLLADHDRSALEVAILRPTAIFGAGGRNLLKLAGELCGGHRLAGYLKACVLHSRRMNLVCVRNVAAATLFLADPQHSLADRVYLVSDDDTESNTYGHVRKHLMDRLGICPDAFPVLRAPAALAGLALWATGSVRTNPRQVYAGRNLAREGFVKPVEFDDELDSFSAWYREVHMR